MRAWFRARARPCACRTCTSSGPVDRRTTTGDGARGARWSRSSARERPRPTLLAEARRHSARCSRHSWRPARRVMRTTAATCRIARHRQLEFECRGVHDYTEIRLNRRSARRSIGFDLRPQRVHVCRTGARRAAAARTTAARAGRRGRRSIAADASRWSVRSRRRSAGRRCWSARRARCRRSSSSSRTRRAAESARSRSPCSPSEIQSLARACVPRQSCRPRNTGGRAARPPRPCGPSATSRRMRVLLTTKSL